ncbi:MAG TPA: hypothetical protein VK327_09890 [Candidatus Paceibacterota bacterium]|nr:hypothetical protein [Candidatus Paceibacterota bacterium]
MKRPRADSELPEIDKLPLNQRVEITTLIREFNSIEAPITKSFERIARVVGCSHQTIRSKYYKWKKSQDRHVLINYAKLPYHDKARYRFYSWWNDLCLQSKSVTEAHHEFVRLFKTGEEIPGLPPVTDRDQLPSGFDYNSLIRHAPKKWVIWRRMQSNGRSHYESFDEKSAVLRQLRKIISDGDSIVDIKFKGKTISAETTLAFLRDAGLRVVTKYSN